jgi:hypothetical protein
VLCRGGVAERAVGAERLAGVSEGVPPGLLGALQQGSCPAGRQLPDHRPDDLRAGLGRLVVAAALERVPRMPPTPR